MTTAIIKYGLLISFLCTFFLFFGKVGSSYGGPGYSLTIKLFIILFILIFGYIAAIIETRHKRGGYLEVSEGQQTGYGVTVILSIIFSIATYAYFKFYLFNITLRDKLQSYKLKLRRGRFGRVTDAELDFWIGLNLDPIILALIALAVIGITGLILTFIITNTFKKPHQKI